MLTSINLSFYHREQAGELRPQTFKAGFGGPFALMPIERLRGRAGCEQRDRIRTRDCGLCRECYRKGALTLGTQVDHVIAIDNGGSNDDDNLELLCDSCHRMKTAKDMGFVPRPKIGADGYPIEG